MKRQHWRWLVSIIGSIVFITLCCSTIAFVLGIISFPPTETLARRYLDTVVKGDAKAAANLAGSQEGCRSTLEEDARKDIAQFGAAEIRNVRIEVYPGTGSDDEIEFATIEFEYRKSIQSGWQQGEMRLITDYPVPGFRYLCGNLKYHGP